MVIIPCPTQNAYNGFLGGLSRALIKYSKYCAHDTPCVKIYKFNYILYLPYFSTDPMKFVRYDMKDTT